MASAFKLIPDPTFTATVPLPLPGRPAVDVVFTFKHLSEEQRFALDDETSTRLQTLRTQHSLPDDPDATPDPEAQKRYIDDVRTVRVWRLLKILSGWELSDEFNESNLRLLLSNYPGAFKSILDTYRDEMDGARTKN